MATLRVEGDDMVTLQVVPAWAWSRAGATSQESSTDTLSEMGIGERLSMFSSATEPGENMTLSSRSPSIAPCHANLAALALTTAYAMQYALNARSYM